MHMSESKSGLPECPSEALRRHRHRLLTELHRRSVGQCREAAGRVSGAGAPYQEAVHCEHGQGHDHPEGHDANTITSGGKRNPDEPRRHRHGGRVGREGFIEPASLLLWQRSVNATVRCELGVRIHRACWTIVGVRMLFADQLGSHFTHDVPAGEPVLLVESRGAFARRRMHRQKAHLLLSAQRHLVAELGDRAIHVRGDSYGEALRAAGVDPRTITVVDPTSYAARRWVREQGMSVLPARGFTMGENDFQEWLGTRRPVLEDFYRHQRRRLDLLVHPDGEPESGRWNFDADNRLPPPKGARTLGLPHPWAPTEDAIDDSVRRDLDAWRDEGITFVGVDAPRTFAATRAEARTALDDFVRHRLAQFGPYEDAVLHADWAMAHSLLSVPLNLGLLDPLEVVDAAMTAYGAGHVPLQSAEAVIRQVIGWREWAWQLYWALGEDYAEGNALGARTPVPDWFADLDADAVQAACLRSALAEVRDRGWSHHIVRLMVLGNWALQRGYDPKSTAAWFRDSFVDGFDWVMVTNVVGMALFADGGRMATKPYAAGGAYLNRMTDHCKGCPYSPSTRVGPKACPFTAGYWAFLDHNSDALGRNHRLAQPYAGLARLADREQLLAEQSVRGDGPP